MDKKMNARKKAQRAARLRKQRNRRVALTLALMFVVAFASIGGTIAWLTASTPEVKNTFTVGDINIDLVETWNTDSDNDNKNDKWEAKLIPGNEYDKDPVVSVDAGSEKCYLFVEAIETNNPSTYLDYSYAMDSDSEWTLLSGTTNKVWWKIVDVSEETADYTYNLLTGDKVTVKESLLKAGSTGSPAMPSEDEAPVITFKAYAVQHANMTNAAEAWSVATTGNKPTT